MEAIRNVETGASMILNKFLSKLGNDKTGATAVEYGLIVSLIVIACVAALKGVANENTGIWAFVRNNVTTVLGG